MYAEALAEAEGEILIYNLIFLQIGRISKTINM